MSLFNFNPPTSVNWQMVAPIASVTVTGMLALIIEMLRPKRNNNLIVGVSILGLLVSLGALLTQISANDATTLNGLLVRDGFSVMAQIVLVLAAILSLLFSEGYLREKRIPFGEFYPLVLWSAAGAMVMASTHNLLVMFVGLELLSVALYVLAGMSRQEEKSEESALKYFLLGAFATGFFLYGIAFMYGATGSLDLREAGYAWHTNDMATRGMVIFGSTLILMGLSFKSSFVPFHQWTPDVYQGAPTNVAAFMASASKVGAIAALWRVLDDARVMADFYLPALFWLAILTMTVGNLVALIQKDVKRILGYSSISHAGYILVAICANLKDPMQTSAGTIMYYLFAYTIMTIGSFAIVSMVAKGGAEGTRIEDLYGLRKRSPLAAVALIIFMISLLGMPPTAGFVGKLLIFQDALTAGLPSLAIVLAINSAISAYYYLGIARAAYVVDEGGRETAPMSLGLLGTTVLCIAGVVGATVLVEQFMAVLAGY